MTGANIVKEALSDIYDYLVEKGYWQKLVYLLLQVHDEIIFEVREDVVEKVVPELKKIMVEAGNKYVSQVNMEVGETISDYWMKDD